MREKLKNMPQGVKASLALFLSNIVTKGIAYISMPFYTRLLSAEEYGQVSIFLTWEMLFGIVAMFSLSAGVFNNGMFDYPDRRDEYSFSMLVLSNLITSIFGIVIVLFYPIIRPFIGLDRNLLFLMCAIFFFQPAYNFWQSRQRFELKYRLSVMWSIILAFLSPLTAILCMLRFDNDRVYARVFGANLVLIIIYTGFYIFIAVKAKWKFDVRYWKAAFYFNLPLIPHYLSGNLLSSADKIMISKLVSDSAAAYYSVAYSVAAVVIVIWTAANASLIPYTYEKCRVKDFNAISYVTLPILVCLAVVCFLIILLAPETVALMASFDYREAIYAIPPIVGGVFFQAQYFIYANVIYYYKKTRYVMYASVISALFNVLLNYILIPKYGYIIAGYTTIFCYLLQAVIDYCAMKVTVGERIYDMRFIGVLSGTMILIALLSNLLYGHTIFRYCIILILICGAIVLRKKIVSRWRILKSIN